MKRGKQIMMLWAGWMLLSGATAYGINGIIGCQDPNTLFGLTAGVLLDYDSATHGVFHSEPDITTCDSDSLDDTEVVWLKFIPAQKGLYAFDFHRTSAYESANTYAVFHECSTDQVIRCTELTEAGSDYFEWCLEAGATYFIRVGRYIEASDPYDFTLLITRIGGAVNDLCANKVVLSAGVKYIGDTLCATGTDISSCGMNDSKDVWHVFTPTQSGQYQFKYNDPNIMCLSVFTQCDPVGTELLCSDPNSYFVNGYPKYCLQAGTDYYVRIAGLNDTTQSYYDVKVKKLQDSAPNDDCAGAAVLTESVLYNGNNICASGVASSGCYNNICNDTKDVWHVFVPASSGEYRFEAQGGTGLQYTLVMQVYAACGDPCDPMLCADPCSLFNQIYPSLCLTQGVPCYVRIAGNNGTEGEYSLQVVKIGDPPANDECANAVELIEMDVEELGLDSFDIGWGEGEVMWNALYHGHNICATGTDLTRQGYMDTRDVWFRVHPEKTGMYMIFFAAEFPGTVAVFDNCNPVPGTEREFGYSCEYYQGDRNNDQSIKGDYDYNYGGWCGVQVQLSNCQDYYIRVAGSGESMGQFALGLISLISPLDNEECDQAYEVETNTMYLGTTLGATGYDLTPQLEGDISDVWFSFTPDQTGEYLVECRMDFYNYGYSTLTIFDECGGNILASNYDFGPWQVVFHAEAGEEYLIRLAGSPMALTGGYALLITEAVAPDSQSFGSNPLSLQSIAASILPLQNPPANDACGSAIPLTPGQTYTGALCEASPSEFSGGQIPTDLYSWFWNLQSYPDVWHVFTAQKDGMYRMDLEAFKIGLVLSVHTDCITVPISLTNFLYGPYAVTALSNVQIQSSIMSPCMKAYLHAVAGQTYRIRLAYPNATPAMMPLGEEIPQIYCNYSLTLIEPPTDCTVLPFTLTVQISGAGSVDPNGGVYDPNTIVPLLANPAPGWHFVGWQGTDDDSSASTSNQVTMFSDRLVTAIFEQDQEPEPPVPLDLFNVIITAGPNGSVNPEGESLQPEGKVLIVTATPAPGYRVKGWTGLPNYYGRAAVIQLLVDSDKFVHVEFELIPEQQPAMYQLTYLITGGQGVIPQTSGEYEEQIVVPLSASPAENYRIKKWTGTDNDGSTANSNAVTMTADKVVTVEFEPIPVNLAFNVIGKGGTTPMTSGPRNQGSVESLLVSLQAGYRIFQWDGADDDATKNASNQVTMDTDKAVAVEIAKSVAAKKLSFKLSSKDGKDTIKVSGEFEAELDEIQNAGQIRVRVFDNLTNLFEESIPFSQSQLKKERKFSYKKSVKTGDPQAVSSLKFDLQKNTVSVVIKNLNLPSDIEGPVYILIDIGDYIGMAEVGSEFVKIKGKN